MRLKKNIIFFLVIIFYIFTRPCLSKNIVTITTGEWPPYISKSLKHQGVVTRIIKEAFELENIKVKFTFFPWKRSKLLTKNGNFDACSVWAKFAVLEKDFYYSETVAKGEFVFFYPRNVDFTWNSVEDLRDYRIGGVLGNIYSKEIKQAEKKGTLKIYYKPAELDVMNLLIHGNVEVLPLNREVGYFLLQKYFSKDEADSVTHHAKALRISHYALIFSKKIKTNRTNLKLFNQGLQKLKKSGKYELYYQESRAGKYIMSANDD
ncbi:MAG: transporter substrate-binding domain-containing protein [Thermodesulfobacteriota bacterium]|nr:transporter substrate-binding domain-containing protein [Thermodesulfobacteriota bacterium]